MYQRMRCLPCFLLLLLLPACDAEPRFEEKWRQCRVDSDCMYVEDACRRPDAIHKQYVNDHQAWVADVAPRIRCPMPNPQSPGPLDVQCLKQQCSVVMPSPSSGSQADR